LAIRKNDPALMQLRFHGESFVAVSVQIAQSPYGGNRPFSYAPKTSQSARSAQHQNG
jgi:hypothetical protein